MENHTVHPGLKVAQVHRAFPSHGPASRSTTKAFGSPWPSGMARAHQRVVNVAGRGTSCGALRLNCGKNLEPIVGKRTMGSNFMLLHQNLHEMTEKGVLTTEAFGAAETAGVDKEDRHKVEGVLPGSVLQLHGWKEHMRWQFGPLVGNETDADISYAAPQAHGIVNVALHHEYYPDIIFIFSQGRKDLYHV
jgi:hypothetical protein